MTSTEDRLSYGEVCQIANETFIKFNGWINPSCKAYRIIFDINDSNLLAMALGNIIVFFPQTVLKFYYEDMNVDFDKNQMKVVVMFLVVHELSHLEQDLGLYEDMYNLEAELVDIVEGSNNANTYNYLLSAQNIGIVDKNIDLMWPSFWYHKMDTVEKYKSYLDQYYRVPSMLTKPIYSLGLICFGSHSDIKDIITKYNNVEIEYQEQEVTIFRKMIKVNNMYIHPDMIMNEVVDYIFLRIYQGIDTRFDNSVQIYTNKNYIKIIVNNKSPRKLMNIVFKK